MKKPIKPARASEKHTITIELSAGQYGALIYLAEHDGYASVEDCLLAGAAANLQSINDTADEVKAFFGLSEGEAEDN